MPATAASPRSKLKSFWRGFLLIALGLWLLLSLWQAPIIKAATNADELRGLWITNLGSAALYSSTRLDETVAEAKQLGFFNTLYPAIWNRGYSSCPSPVANKPEPCAVTPSPAFRS